MHHFRFAFSLPGAVFVKTVGSGAEQQINLLRNTSWAPSAHDLPDIVVPAGLSSERQQYLLENFALLKSRTVYVQNPFKNNFSNSVAL